MPQKRNPIISEAIIAAARHNASLLSSMHHALIQEQERATGSWQLEWITLPEMLHLIASSLRHALFLGKNLVVMMLKGSGFEVRDLGVDCRIETFEEAVNGGAQVICLSALLSTTRNEMRPVIEHFRDQDVKIVVGGAVITEEFADSIGADAFGIDASDAVRAVRQSLGLEAIPA